MEDNQRLMCIPKRIHSKVMEVFQFYNDSIADILGDSTSTFKEYEIIMQDLEMDLPFGSDIWDFFKKHEGTLAFLSKRYLEIQDLGGDPEKIELPNNQFKKYINGLRKKKIGMVKDENVLDPNDRTYWSRQNIFKEIVEEHITKYYQTRKSKYHYTTVQDVLDFFSGNAESESNYRKDLYNHFRNEYGEFDFHLSQESVGKYMKNITRFFFKHRIHFKGRRLNIYSLVNNDLVLKKTV